MTNPVVPLGGSQPKGVLMATWMVRITFAAIVVIVAGAALLHALSAVQPVAHAVGG